MQRSVADRRNVRPGPGPRACRDADGRTVAPGAAPRGGGHLRGLPSFRPHPRRAPAFRERRRAARPPSSRQPLCGRWPPTCWHAGPRGLLPSKGPGPARPGLLEGSSPLGPAGQRVGGQRQHGGCREAGGKAALGRSRKAGANRAAVCAEAALQGTPLYPAGLRGGGLSEDAGPEARMPRADTARDAGNRTAGRAIH